MPKSFRVRTAILALALLPALGCGAGLAQTTPRDDDYPAPAHTTSTHDDGSRREDATDAMRRAQDLSRMPPRDDGTPDNWVPPRPANPDLSGQIGQLGASIAQNQSARAIIPLAPVTTRRPGSGVPPAGERRLVPDEVVVEVAANATPQAIGALAQRNGLALIDQLASQLTGTTLLLFRIQDRLAVTAKLRALGADAAVLSAQPNYLFTLAAPNDTPAKKADAPLQYALAKLHLPEAHRLAEGDKVLVGVIDSGIDAAHPELTGSIAATFDAIGKPGNPHDHGTAIAALIVGHARLVGSAPKARILAVRAFDAAPSGAQGTSFNILKGLDWAAVKGARVINMSFAGPSDPALHRALEAAWKNAIVLIAAAGNAGAKSPPLYPGADPHVVAVTATDAADRFFVSSNRGRYIAVAAPGVDLLVAAPAGGYQISSGTSFSAAEVSGIAALMLEKRPDLGPDAVRAILVASARPLGAGPRLADAYQALSAAPPRGAQVSAGR